MSIEERVGKSEEPIARNTPLGWTCVGKTVKTRQSHYVPHSAETVKCHRGSEEVLDMQSSSEFKNCGTDEGDVDKNSHKNHDQKTQISSSTNDSSFTNDSSSTFSHDQSGLTNSLPQHSEGDQFNYDLVDNKDAELGHYERLTFKLQDSCDKKN